MLAGLARLAPALQAGVGRASDGGVVDDRKTIGDCFNGWLRRKHKGGSPQRWEGEDAEPRGLAHAHSIRDTPQTREAESLPRRLPHFQTPL